MSDASDDTEFFDGEPPLETVVLDYESAPEHEADVGPVVARDREARLTRLSDGADRLRDRAGSFLERTGMLVIVAGVLVTLGLSLIVVAWKGVSSSIHIEEQVPYVVSGGILGATLAIIGAFCLFTHWLTIGIREARVREERAQRRHEELLGALELRDGQPSVEGGNNGHSADRKRQRPLRSAPRGS